MSANIPFDIQVEIIKRLLPVKSLVRFRSVSKQWKSLIDSSQFITHHTLNHTQPHHHLIWYTDTVDFSVKYISISDADSFSLHNFSHVVPPTIKLGSIISILDCSHGLVSLYGVSRDPVNSKKLTVLWNPSIRKSVGISIPYEFDVVGCGVCPRTSDTKIVAVTRYNSLPGSELKAEIYTLSSGAWRSISMNLRRPLELLNFSHKPVVIDGVIHWIAYDNLPRRVISFDLASEEFGDVELPDSLAHVKALSLFNYKGSLAVLNYNEAALVCDVWTMIKTGDPKSWFTKLFSVSFKQTDDKISCRILGFRKNGQMITQHVCMRPDNSQVTTLEVYESYPEHNNHLPVSIAFNSYIMKTSYTESLLLLNHSDSVIL